MFSPSPRRLTARAAFTLVELLVSMAVLVLLTVSVAQLVSSATAVTTGGRKRLDADAQARFVFDRMMLDFSKMLKRPDVSYLFAKNAGGSDTLFFYSEAPGFYDTAATTAAQASSVTLAGYRINAAYQLERLGRRLTWENVAGASASDGIVFLSPLANASNPFAPDPVSTLAGHWPTALGNAPAYQDGNDDNYHTLAEQVFRLEYCYQLQDGNYSTVPVLNSLAANNNLIATKAPAASDDSGTYTVGSRWYDQTSNCAYVCTSSAKNAAVWKFIGMQDVRAVVVAVAVLDATSGKTVPLAPAVTIGAHSVQPPQLDQLAKALTDAPLPSDNTGTAGNAGSTDGVYFPATNVVPTATSTPARLMAEAWNNKLKTLLAGGTPPINRTALAQVRIYQRYFTLNTNAAPSN